MTNSSEGGIPPGPGGRSVRLLHAGFPDKGITRNVPVLLGLLLLWAVLPQPFYASQLSAQDILNKVSEAYTTLRSCQLLGEESSELTLAGEDRSSGETAFSNLHEAKETHVELSAAEPGKVRLVVKDDKLDVLLVSDGRMTWVYLPKQKKCSESPGVPSESGDASRPALKAEAQFLAQYWSLLVGRFRGASQLAPAAKLEKDSRIKVGRDKVDCYVVKVQTQDVTHEMWVDKDRFVVLRFKQTPLRPLEGMAYQTAITVNMTEANVNTALDDSLFGFTPPQDVMKVPSLMHTAK